jgi:nicotinamide-nucleotide amidase
VNIELINTGSELLLGRVLNTHAQWLGRQFADLGHTVARQVTVDDGGPAIRAAVREALGRADLIITTGGLGPTSDDRTRDLIAALLGRPLRMDAAALDHVVQFFAARQRPVPESTKVQGLVPEGADVLMNAHGTAPGLILGTEPGQFRAGRNCLVMLPGPPRELRPMFTNQVVPILQKRFPLETAFVCRTLKTTGLGESRLEEIIAGPLQHLTGAGLELGYCARTGEVDLRFVARGGGAAELVAGAERIVRGLVPENIYGVDDDQLEAVIVRLLAERKQTLALAESCTGGQIANRLTNVPGASAVLWGGLVTYSNEAKVKLLGMPAATLAQHGAVSEETARAMAEGARKVSGADHALAVTGIAGPSGGSEAKPVGTVFIARATPDQTVVLRCCNRYDRETFKHVTSQQALELLRRGLLDNEKPAS